MHTSILPHGFHFFERGWLSSNSLLIHGKSSSAIFDTGYLTHSPQLLDLVRHTLSSQPLDLIVNSHLHSDHCGGNALLQQAYPSVEIKIPAQQFQSVQDWDESALTYSSTGQQCQSFKPTHGLVDGDILEIAGTHWKAIAGPGHDNDEFIFHEPNLNILISADALWEHGLGVVFPEFLGGIGFQNVAWTLDLIEELNPRLVLPGHGSAFKDVTHSISQARRRLDLFAGRPDLHATYASKVLLKFKLLEVQAIEIQELQNWALNKPLMNLIHKRFFDGTEIKIWIESLIHELVARKSAMIQNGLLCNS